MNELLVFVLTMMIIKIEIFKNRFMDLPIDSNEWKNVYRNSYWYKNLYVLLKFFLKKLSIKLMQKFFNCRLIKFILWIFHKDCYLSCVLEEKILNILRNAHSVIARSNLWRNSNPRVRSRVELNSQSYSKVGLEWENLFDVRS